MAASLALPATALHLRRVHAWVKGGLVAAGLDLAFATTFWAVRADVSPLRVLQSIAAGVFGQASFTGGGATAVMGACLHIGIALAMAAAYVRLGTWLPALKAHPLRHGALYGLLLYAVMTFAVVPLSAAGPLPTDPVWAVASVLAHVLLVGMPIAWFARRA